MNETEIVQKIYHQRFSAEELKQKTFVWDTLCHSFFQKLVGDKKNILEIGAGAGDFLRAIKAKRKIAIDINPSIKTLEKIGIETHVTNVRTFDANLLQHEVDVVFASNFFEHLPEKKHVSEVLIQCRKMLRPGGKTIILQPNINFLSGRYWDYIDHHIALNHVSMTEALKISGFSVERCIPKFLPYTIKGNLGEFYRLLPFYIKLPFLWYFFGKQMLIVAKTPLSVTSRN